MVKNKIKKLLKKILRIPKKILNLQSQIERNGFGPVVQLVRMPPCHGGGRGFESRPDRKLKTTKM